MAITNGFSNAASTVPIIYSNFQCSGSERRLTDCGKTADTASCSHTNDAGVRCINGEFIMEMAHCSKFLLQAVLMEISGSLAATLCVKDVWKSVIIISGDRFVILNGTTKKPK